MAGFRHWAAQMETAESNAWGGFFYYVLLFVDIIVSSVDFYVKRLQKQNCYFCSRLYQSIKAAKVRLNDYLTVSYPFATVICDNQ